MRKPFPEMVKVSNNLKQEIFIQHKANPMDPGNTLKEKWQDVCVLDFENAYLDISESTTMVWTNVSRDMVVTFPDQSDPFLARKILIQDVLRLNCFETLEC